MAGVSAGTSVSERGTRISLGKSSLVKIVVATLLLGNNTARAQFTASYQTNIISGIAVDWTGDYIVGANTVLPFADDFDHLQVIDGGLLSNSNGYIGRPGSHSNSALVSGSGSIWSNQGSLYIQQEGSLVISNSGAVFCNLGYVDFVASYHGSVLVTGSGSVWSNQGTLTIGNHTGDSSSLVINSGGKVFSTGGVIGFYDRGGDRVLVSGSGSVWNNQGSLLISGYDCGTESLVINDGGAVFSTTAKIGAARYSAANSVLVTGSGSVWSNQGAVVIGYYEAWGDNNLVVSNGGKVVTGGVDVSASSHNSVLVSGSGSVWSNQGSFVIGGSSAASSYPNNGCYNSLVISDGGSVVTSNTVVAPTNSIALDRGNLTVDGGLEISSNAVLQGTGTIRADITLAGRLAPGNPAGTITNFGNLTLQSTAILEFQLGGTIQGADYGFILVTNGVVTLDGYLQVGLLSGFETNVLSSETFTLLTGTNALDGSFANVLSGQRLTTASGEGSFLVDYSGNSLTLSDYKLIPEPAAMWLVILSFAFLPLLGMRYSRRR
jgi:fibronectin-binding autotransporter adhesin